MPKSTSSDPYLKRLYNLYNRLYWSESLPGEAIVRWSSQRRMKEGKFTLWGVASWVDTGYEEVPVIELNSVMRKRKNRKSWGSALKQTLLHEMTHIAKPRANHGPVFDAEMLRIARMGAMHGIW